MVTQPDCDPERPGFENEPPVLVGFTAAACTGSQTIERGTSMLGTILLVVLVLLLLGAFPRWGYSRNWGYGPSGGLGLVLVIVLILVLLGRI